MIVCAPFAACKELPRYLKDFPEIFREAGITDITDPPQVLTFPEAKNQCLEFDPHRVRRSTIDLQGTAHAGTLTDNVGGGGAFQGNLIVRARNLTQVPWRLNWCRCTERVGARGESVRPQRCGSSDESVPEAEHCWWTGTRPRCHGARSVGQRTGS